MQLEDHFFISNGSYKLVACEKSSFLFYQATVTRTNIITMITIIMIIVIIIIITLFRCQVLFS